MERHDRTPVATFFADAQFSAGEPIELSEAAAHHARVKRLAQGDWVQLTDGVGRRALGCISSMGKKSTVIDVDTVDSTAASRAIHLRVPVADRDRMLWLAEKATELGVTSWQAIRFRRSASVSPRGEGPSFAEKIRARMISALEQSGSAWLPSILPDLSLESLLGEAHVFPILLDANGESLRSIACDRGDIERTILVGPEGGLEAGELSTLIDCGWARARLSRNILRFETAGIAALAALRSMEMLSEE